MNPSNTVASVEAARLPLMLTELRLPTAKRLWPELAEQANREGWPAERFLAGLLEHEIAERETRRLQRNRTNSQLPAGKTLEAFEFDAVPTVSKAHVESPRVLRRLQFLREWSHDQEQQIFP